MFHNLYMNAKWNIHSTDSHNKSRGFAGLLLKWWKRRNHSLYPLTFSESRPTATYFQEQFLVALTYTWIFRGVDPILKTVKMWKAWQHCKNINLLLSSYIWLMGPNFRNLGMKTPSQVTSWRLYKKSISKARNRWLSSYSHVLAQKAPRASKVWKSTKTDKLAPKDV